MLLRKQTVVNKKIQEFITSVKTCKQTSKRSVSLFLLWKLWVLKNITNANLFIVTRQKIDGKYNSMTECCCKLPTRKILNNLVYINRKAPPNTKLYSLWKTKENFITVLIYKTFGIKLGLTLHFVYIFYIWHHRLPFLAFIVSTIIIKSSYIQYVRTQVSIVEQFFKRN